MRFLRPIALVSAVTFNLPAAAGSQGNICEREMARAAVVYKVPLGILYAVGLTETGRKGSLQPYAMNIEGQPFFATNLQDATRHFEDARRRGARLIDVGCMQINHYYHGSHFASLADMFDPSRNVTYAAQFLQELKGQHGSWTLAAARYHAGPDKNIEQRKYVCTVITNMVATGFGAWTTNARAFCL
jgi:soluble lytic murein transglycosylase-like protein